MASANGVLVAQYWGKKDRSSAKTVNMLVMNCGVKILIPVTLVINTASLLTKRNSAYKQLHLKLYHSAKLIGLFLHNIKRIGISSLDFAPVMVIETAGLKKERTGCYPLTPLNFVQCVFASKIIIF